MEVNFKSADEFEKEVKDWKRITILVRKNLRMTDKKLAAQCVHAALGLHKKCPNQHYSCVVLDASDVKFQQAKTEHPEHYVVTDAGLTEVPEGTETCLAYWSPDPRVPELIEKTRLLEKILLDPAPKA